MEPWIKLANLLPLPDAPFPEPKTLQPEGEHRAMLGQLYTAFQAFRLCCLPADVWQRYVKRWRRLGLPRPAESDRLLEGASLKLDPGTLRWFQRCRSGERLYPVFHTVRAALDAIARAVPRMPEAPRVTRHGSPVMVTPRPLPSVEFRLPQSAQSIVAVLKEDGSLQLQDPYHDFLHQLESVEVGRVRRCPVCGRFFWAQRKKAACSARCGNTYRVRFHRENAAKYAATWRENRRVKKQRAKGRIFKNERDV
jgi:hypothetical protein